jgi:hypothetical protein
LRYRQRRKTSLGAGKNASNEIRDLKQRYVSFGKKRAHINEAGAVDQVVLKMAALRKVAHWCPATLTRSLVMREGLGGAFPPGGCECRMTKEYQLILGINRELGPKDKSFGRRALSFLSFIVRNRQRKRLVCSLCPNGHGCV